MRCLALRHLAFEDLGLFEPELKAHGFEIEYRQAGMEPLHEEHWRNVELVVVLGGPIAAYDSGRYPWLVDQMDGLRQRLALRLPTLGLCLGAQQMAHAMGARVYAGPTKEIGWAGVTLSDAGLASCLAPLAELPVLHWHGDTFDLPADAELLASTATTPNQAFSVGAHALALQFHPEVDPAHIEVWLIGHAVELAQAGVNVRALRAQSATLGNATPAAAAAVLSRWLNGWCRCASR